MPSLTEAQIGVSVSLPLNYTNADLIFKLLDIDNVMLYLSGLNEDPDEVKLILCIDDEEEFDSFHELAELENEEQFKKKYEELEENKRLSKKSKSYKITKEQVKYIIQKLKKNEPQFIFNL